MRPLILLFMLFAFSNMTQAACLIPPNKIEEVAQRIMWQTEDGEELSAAIVQANAEGNVSTDTENSTTDSQVTAVYEAFLRPDEDGTFHLLPIPFFVFEMQRKRNSIYVCAHLDSKDDSKTKVLIYFLRQGEIKTIIPKLLPLQGITDSILKNLGKTPLIVAALPFKIGEIIQSTAFTIFSDFTQIGIDRVLIQNRQVELYSGGDPTQFEKYVIKKVVPMKGQ